MAWNPGKVYIKLGDPRCRVVRTINGKYVGSVKRYIHTWWKDHGTCLVDTDASVTHYTPRRYDTADAAMKAAIRLSKKKITLTLKHPPRYRRKKGPTDA